jgi:diguanylate cyclase (GGDEF)-like protein/PAS domain S-box-containing protein
MAATLGRGFAAAIALGSAYFIACAGVVTLTRFDGGVAFVWIANAILTAQLTTLRYRHWPLPMAICFITGAIATATLGLGPAMAIPLAIANVGESAFGAALLHRFVGRRAMLDSHRWLIVFVLATGIVAPLASAIVAGAFSAVVLKLPFLATSVHWYSGHALGTLAFMPIAMLIIRGRAKSLIQRMGRKKLLELGLLLAFVTVISLVTFTQDHLPLLFLPVLPIVLATFRGGPLSTAASIVILAVIGGALTLGGHGPVSLIEAPIGAQVQFLQLYIACTMLTVLPATAELERRSELFRSLRESEARYRMVTENSTDIILNADLTGRLRFVSASIRQIGGYKAEDLIGRSFSVLLHPDDMARAAASLRRTIEHPDGVTISEYRGLNSAAEVRWFETQSRAVVDEDGTVTGVVSAIRDVTYRKAHEERLARAALTDVLTGLINRRGFNEELAARLASGTGGCVALFDLDHFKRVNDTCGHPAGDEVLRRFAALARVSVRDQDLVARVGGEEFAIVLPEATIDQAKLVCDRLRCAVADERIRIDDHVIAVTVSGGVARYRAGQSVEDVLRAADVALYRAKDAGRDRLALAA